MVLALAFCTGNSADAQTPDNVFLLNAYALRSDDAAAKATRDFWSRAGAPKKEAWYKLPIGYLATCAEEGVESRYVYDRKGHWIYSISTYQEDHLPEAVKREVKSNFYDFSIGWIKEVKEGEEDVYVVHVENKEEWKDLAVQNGNISVLKAFLKQ